MVLGIGRADEGVNCDVGDNDVARLSGSFRGREFLRGPRDRTY